MVWEAIVRWMTTLCNINCVGDFMMVTGLSCWWFFLWKESSTKNFSPHKQSSTFITKIDVTSLNLREGCFTMAVFYLKEERTGSEQYFFSWKYFLDVVDPNQLELHRLHLRHIDFVAVIYSKACPLCPKIYQNLAQIILNGSWLRCWSTLCFKAEIIRSNESVFPISFSITFSLISLKYVS